MSRILLAALALATLAGCAVLTSPDRKFAANDPVLRSIEAKMRYVVDPDRYRLVRAEVAEDAVTLHYLGVEYPGDQAWVVRFSEKSTEKKMSRRPSESKSISTGCQCPAVVLPSPLDTVTSEKVPSCRLR